MVKELRDKKKEQKEEINQLEELIKNFQYKEGDKGFKSKIKNLI